MAISKRIRDTKKYMNNACPCGSTVVSYKCCWRGGERWEKTSTEALIMPEAGSIEKCYLSMTNSCGDKISKEHFVSRNILEQIAKSGKGITVGGGFFPGADTLTVGLDSFTAKVLCDKHNTSLSPLDYSAGKSFSVIEQLVSTLVSNDREGKKQSFFGIISGADLERWAIKVLIGLIAAKKVFSLNKRVIELSEVDQDLFRYVIDGGLLQSPMGIYTAFKEGNNYNLQGVALTQLVLTDGSDQLGGLRISLPLLEVILVSNRNYGTTWSDAHFVYRLSQPIRIVSKEHSVRLLVSY